MQVGWKCGHGAGRHATFLLKGTLSQCIHPDDCLFSVSAAGVPGSGAQTLHQILQASQQGAIRRLQVHHDGGRGAAPCGGAQPAAVPSAGGLVG